MEVSVLLFGPAAAAARSTRVRVTLDGGRTADELLRMIEAQHPALAAMCRSGGRIAVNHVFADSAQSIGADDEVAFIALVGGG